MMHKFRRSFPKEDTKIIHKQGQKAIKKKAQKIPEIVKGPKILWNEDWTEPDPNQFRFGPIFIFFNIFGQSASF